MEKAPEAMPFFGKPHVQPEAMQIFNANNGTGRKKAPEAMLFLGKPQMQPQAMQIFNSKNMI